MKNLILITALMAAGTASASTAQVRASNETGLKWTREAIADDLRQKKTARNTLVSPVSAYAALSLLQGGLSGNTRSDLHASLGLSEVNPASLDRDNIRFLRSLRRDPADAPAAVDCESPKHEKGAKSRDRRPRPPVVGIHNSAWGTSNLPGRGVPFEFSKPYTSLLKAYEADPRTDLDFRTQAAVDAINGWAARKTNCLIRHVITPDALAQLVWVLMNATYMEASWEEPFRALGSGSAPPFTTLNGEAKAVPMITKNDHLRVLTDRHHVAVEIPFFDNGPGDLALIVLQPHSIEDFRTGLADGSLLEPSLWSKLIDELRGDARAPSFVRLNMPKFSFGYSLQMTRDRELTKATGLNFLFIPTAANRADFLSLGDPATVVGIIKQDAKIELDEFGVKAAAVTLIGGIERTAVPAEPKQTINIDKPFAFAIASKSTGALLFTGIVVEPTAAD